MHLYDKKPLFRWKGIVVTIVVFLAVVVGLTYLMGRTGSTADREQADLLRKALRNAAVMNYAVEGSYPATLDEIVGEYGIIVDHDRFRVRYEIFSSTVMPTITVGIRGEGGQ